VKTFNVNVAVTDFVAFIVTVQEAPVALSQPDQLVKSESTAGVAVSVTEVLTLYVSEQSVPQLIPVGLLVTVPFPVFVTVKAKFLRVNVAVTVFAASIVTTQLPVAAVQAPLQPVKIEIPLAAAVNVTCVPISYASLQSAPAPVPQLIPAGLLVIVPSPVPVFVTVRTGFRVKLATTDFTESIVTTHPPVPEQDPFQPVKLESSVGAAVKATWVPALYVSEQSPPQLIPGPLTVPPPVPTLLTEREYGFRVKVAATVWAPFIATVHEVSVALSQPDQPSKVESSSGAAVSVTVSSTAKGAEQVVPQLIPGRSLVIVPCPFPGFSTCNVSSAWSRSPFCVAT
jgi:hypothetical protein